MSAVAERDAVHGYFGLSYANFVVLPRTLMQSMPDEWQQRIVALLEEYDEHWADLPDGYAPLSYRVQPVEDGRLAPWRRFRLPHYNRGRTRVAADGSVIGGRFPRLLQVSVQNVPEFVHPCRCTLDPVL